MTPPIGIVRNNPGNLCGRGIPYEGLSPVQPPDGPLVFITLLFGIRAFIRDCYANQMEGVNTPASFIAKFSPAAAGNPTAQYCTNVCGWTGFSANQLLNFHDPAVMVPWAQSIFRQEQGPDHGITDDQIRQAILAAQES